MKHITSMGAVWRLTNSSFKKLSLDLQSGTKDIDLDNYGPLIIPRLYSLDELTSLPQKDSPLS